MTKDMKLSELADELERLPIRREVFNLGTDLQRYGNETVVLSLELRDRILTALRDSTEREAVLEQLRAEFQKWLDKGPDEQPHYPSGMRPFSTGDLKAFVAALATPASAAESDWFAGDVDCDGNELVTIRADELQKLRDEREKFMWQVRDTCTRAEKAEAALAALKSSPTNPSEGREADNRPVCSADGCHRREPCGPFCRDKGNFK